MPLIDMIAHCVKSVLEYVFTNDDLAEMSVCRRKKHNLKHAFRNKPIIISLASQQSRSFTTEY